MKNLILIYVMTTVLFSCNKTDSTQVNIDKQSLYGTWVDISSLPDGWVGSAPTLNGAIFTLNEDNTYTVGDSNEIIDIFRDGSWEFFEEADSIVFHASVIDTLISKSLEAFRINKSWKILDLVDDKLSVNYYIQRDEKYITNPITNLIDTVQAINIKMYRELEKIE